jgi:hypothetical protein
MKSKLKIAVVAVVASLGIAGCGSSTTTRTVTVTGPPSHATVIAAPDAPGQTRATNAEFAAACVQANADATTFETDAQALGNDLQTGSDTSIDSSAVSDDMQALSNDVQAMNVARGNTDLQFAGLDASAVEFAGNPTSLDQSITTRSEAETTAATAACS